MPMCFEFNAAAREEQAKLMGQRKRIFAKTAALLKEHHKNKMRIENEEATQRQLTLMQDKEGVSRTVTVGRGLEEVRNRLTEGAEQLDFPAIMDGPPEAQQPMAVAADETNGLQNRIAVVPPRLLEGNPSSMPAMSDLRHIQMLAPNANQPIEANDLRQPSESNMPEEHDANQNNTKRQKRCYGCGNKHMGNNHKGGKKTNKESHCRVPQEERHPNWVVPHGCNVRDEINGWVDPRKVKRLWK